MVVKVGSDKGHVAVVGYGLRIPRAFRRHVVLIRDPSDAVAVLAVDPAVQPGIIHINGLFYAEGFRRKVFKDLVGRLSVPYHLINNVTGKHYGVLSYDEIVVKFLRRLHGVHTSLKLDALFCGAVIIAADAGHGNGKKKYERRGDNAFDSDVFQDVTDPVSAFPLIVMPPKN